MCIDGGRTTEEFGWTLGTYGAVVSGSCVAGRQMKSSVAQKTERRMKQLHISKTKNWSPSHPWTSTTNPTGTIHNSMPPQSDPKIFHVKERAISHLYSGQQLWLGLYQMYPPSSASPSSSSSSSASSPLSSASFSSSSSHPTPLPKSPEYPITSSRRGWTHKG